MTEELSVTLKEYVDARFCDSQRAIEAARESMEKRLDGMNEFRDTLRDQAARFVSRTEHDALCDRLGALERQQAQTKGKASQNSVIFAGFLAVLALVLGIADLVLRIR